MHHTRSRLSGAALCCIITLNCTPLVVTGDARDTFDAWSCKWPKSPVYVMQKSRPFVCRAAELPNLLPALPLPPWKGPSDTLSLLLQLATLSLSTSLFRDTGAWKSSASSLQTLMATDINIKIRQGPKQSSSLRWITVRLLSQPLLIKARSSDTRTSCSLPSEPQAPARVSGLQAGKHAESRTYENLTSAPCFKARALLSIIHKGNWGLITLDALPRVTQLILAKYGYDFRSSDAKS